MTSETLHDAITLLPTDLITEADKKRSAPRAPIRWQRYAAMAACCALVMAGSMWCLQILSRGGAKEAAAEVPAAMQITIDEAAPEEMPAEAAPKAEAAAPESAAGEAVPETSICTDSNQSADTGCYGTTIPEVTISGACESRILTSDERLTLSRLLSGLTYRTEDVCECIAEITVTVNGEEKFFINLDEGFVRGPQGQAKLTQTQTETLRELLFPQDNS